MSKAKSKISDFDQEDAEFRKKLGHALQAARRKLNMTPEEIARVSGIESVTSGRIRLIESGAALDLNFRETLRLCDVCGVSFSRLMGEWGKRNGLTISVQRG